MFLTDYLVGFYFNVRFNGVPISFQEVSGISKEMAVEEVVSGGENRFKYRLPTVSSSQNLILKRAITPIDSAFTAWLSASLDNGLALPIVKVLLTVELLGSSGLPMAGWVFHDAYPVKYVMSDLKSQDNQLAIESIELAYTYFDIL